VKEARRNILKALKGPLGLVLLLTFAGLTLRCTDAKNPVAGYSVQHEMADGGGDRTGDPPTATPTPVPTPCPPGEVCGKGCTTGNPCGGGVPK